MKFITEWNERCNTQRTKGRDFFALQRKVEILTGNVMFWATTEREKRKEKKI
jgi:hypothetical protein